MLVPELVGVCETLAEGEVVADETLEIEAETETVPLGEPRAEALLDGERVGERLTVTDTVGVLLLAMERVDLGEPVEEIVPEGLAETEGESEEVLLADADLETVGEAVGVRLAVLDREPEVETVGEVELRGEAETLLRACLAIDPTNRSAVENLAAITTARAA